MQGSAIYGQVANLAVVFRRSPANAASTAPGPTASPRHALKLQHTEQSIAALIANDTHTNRLAGSSERERERCVRREREEPNDHDLSDRSRLLHGMQLSLCMSSDERPLPPAQRAIFMSSPSLNGKFVQGIARPHTACINPSQITRHQVSGFFYYRCLNP